MYQIDAFTTTRYQGNPAGVVANADGLSVPHMQEIARELNNSETAFVLKPTSDDHDLHVRFFTPTSEVPVCGHATLAAHYVMALEGRPTGSYRQLTGAGVQRVRVSETDNDYLVTIEQNQPVFTSPLPPDVARDVLDALGVDFGAVDPRCPLQFVSTGHGKLLIGLRERKTLQQLAPDLGRLTALSEAAGTKGYFAFTLDTPGDDEAYTWGRMFAPAIGIAEDPVTGNANGPLGAYLVRHSLLAVESGFVRYRARQAAANGRGGWMDVTVSAESGSPASVQIEGRAVMCFQTTLPSGTY
ncbi:PhzF family phenazine biosynthesis isomerase [Frateuria terrea]|uniref:PhzF family phenazine biosynthesis isomerase n=1 Tax=Frateuria terrea TaxID=529704 RepID=UPI001C314900|nr:PhzF family phenazine biosynthesis isomerase [Frateuria terrea]